VARFDFDRQLAPYDLQRYSQWASLSGCISSTVLQQLLPVSRLVLQLQLDACMMIMIMMHNMYISL
jgi:hypothetical protein